MPYSKEVNDLWDILSDRPVGYHPKLARAVGGAKEGIFLCQFLYWRGKGARDDGFIWKNQDEITEETALSRYEQETARKNLRELGVLEEERGGVPYRLYYRINMARLTEVVSDYLRSEAEGDAEKQHAEKPHKRAETPHASVQQTPEQNAESLHAIHESTHEMSQETTTRGGAISPSSGDPDAVEELVSLFEQETKLKRPVIKYPRSPAEDDLKDNWYYPMDNVLDQAEGNLDKAKEAVSQTISKMDSDDLTYKNPLSISGMARKYLAGKVRGLTDPIEAQAMNMQRG